MQEDDSDEEEKKESGAAGENDCEAEELNTGEGSSRFFTRADYTGRSSVKAVRDARKSAGLNDSFDITDPLLMEFTRFLKTSGASENDTHNKVIIYSSLTSFYALFIFLFNM